MESLASAGVVIGVLFAILFFYTIARMLYKKAGPDEALIVYGRTEAVRRQGARTSKGVTEGFRIVRGGGTFVWPAWEQDECSRCG